MPVDTDTNTWRPAQTLAVSGQTLSISSGNSVSLPGGSGCPTGMEFVKFDKTGICMDENPTQISASCRAYAGYGSHTDSRKATAYARLINVFIETKVVAERGIDSGWERGTYAAGSITAENEWGADAVTSATAHSSTKGIMLSFTYQKIIRGERYSGSCSAYTDW